MWAYFDDARVLTFIALRIVERETMKSEDTITYGQAVEAVGYVSSVLATRSGAWEGKAPAWFPQPPEWLDLFDRGLALSPRDEHT